MIEKRNIVCGPKTINENLAQLKQNIEKAYAEYLRENIKYLPLRNSKLVILAKFFGITLDDDLDSYYVQAIDLEDLSITISNANKRQTFKAAYTDFAKPLGYTDINKSYLAVVETRNRVTIANVYPILRSDGKSVDPIASELYIEHGGYALAFDKRYDRHEIYTPYAGAEEFSVNLIDHHKHETDMLRHDPLFSKTYRCQDNREPSALLEQTYSDPLGKGTLKKRIYTRQTGISYFLDGFSDYDAGGHKNIAGICIENYTGNIPKDLGLNWYQLIGHKKNLTSILNKSVIYFVGCATPGQKDVLEIYKDSFGIHITYKFGEIALIGPSPIDPIIFSDTIGRQKVGCITEVEIGSIINTLESKYGYREFIQAVILELKEFARRISINRGFAVEDEDPLSPHILESLSMKELEGRILADPENYFALVTSQYAATHLTKKDGKSFSMRPVDEASLGQ